MGQAADQLSSMEMSHDGAAGGGSPSAAQLRAQIDRQRGELGRDLEVLGDRVSPGRMIDRRRQAVRRKGHDLKDRIMGAADSASSRMGDAAGSMGDSMGSMADSLQDTAGSMGERIGSAPQSAAHAAQGAPIAVGLMAFGAGVVLASLLPTSERERRFATEQAQPVLERAAEGAGHVAQQAVDELAPKAQEAAESLRSSAQEAAEEVAGQASSAADELKTTASS